MSNEDTRTLAQLAEEAIFVQSACNLSGVVLGYGRAICRLKELVGASAATTHPISVAWADKISSLVGIQDLGNDRAMDAHSKCDDIVKAGNQ